MTNAANIVAGIKEGTEVRYYTSSVNNVPTPDATPSAWYPVAEVVSSGVTADCHPRGAGHPWALVKVADVHNLRDGKVWSWITFSIGVADVAGGRVEVK